MAKNRNPLKLLLVGRAAQEALAQPPGPRFRRRRRNKQEVPEGARSAACSKPQQQLVPAVESGREGIASRLAQAPVDGASTGKRQKGAQPVVWTRSFAEGGANSESGRRRSLHRSEQVSAEDASTKESGRGGVRFATQSRPRQRKLVQREPLMTRWSTRAKPIASTESYREALTHCVD